MEPLAENSEMLDGLCPDPNHPGRSTGPRTPAGKSNSCRNALTHGCRSQMVILPGECQEDFDDLYDRWTAAYQPEDDAATELVEQLILNKWFLERNLRRFMALEAKLASTGYIDWSEAQHKEYQLATRYKTAADRAVSRSLRDLEVHLKCRKQEEKDARRAKESLYDLALRCSDEYRKQDASIEKRIAQAKSANVDISEEVEALNKSQRQTREVLDNVKRQLADFDLPKTRAQTLFQGQNHPRKLRKIAILEQWVEIRVEDGKTVTKLFPPNEKLIEEGQAMLPPPELVYRRFDFVNGVPPEYLWTTKDEYNRKYGGAGIQRMTVDRWLEVIEREKADPNGHIGKCGGNLPRPKERGGCDCEVCSHNRAILERLPTEPRP